MSAHPSPPSVSSFNVPLSTYLSSVPHDGIATAAVIIRDARVLLLQRASTDSWPLLWELPGGGVDAADSSILAGVVREVYEETGLHVRSVDGVVGTHEFVSSRGKRIGRVVFRVSVAGGDVRLAEDEHAAFEWASEGDVRGGRFEFTSGAAKGLVVEGCRGM